MWLDHVGSIDHVCTICVGTRLLVHDIFRGVELLYEIYIFFLMGTEAPLAICRGCVLGPTPWESHCQLTAGLPVTPPFFP